MNGTEQLRQYSFPDLPHGGNRNSVRRAAQWRAKVWSNPIFGVLLYLLSAVSPGLAANWKVAAFRADVTPNLGEPLIWVTPAVQTDDPLWAKGVVLDDGKHRYVLCALDWCGVGGSVYELFRRRIAEKAGTEVSYVALHSVHQHTAPYVEGDGMALLERQSLPGRRMSQQFLQQTVEHLGQAVGEATTHLEPVDQIGIGEATVRRSASARRIFHQGKLLTRYSTGGRDPLQAELPEGAIDPQIRTITFLQGNRALVRIHYYAVHPQTFCCDGHISGDFVGLARERVEQKERVPQIYFTGCAGDVTVGKYNDGSRIAREKLAGNLEEGMTASIQSTRFLVPGKIRWSKVSLDVPPRDSAYLARHRAVLEEPQKQSGDALYRAAIALEFAARKKSLELSSLCFGEVCILHLPGEPMLEFQNYALALRPALFTSVAGYGDIRPGYLCTDQAFEQGGYEPGASNAGPGTESRLKSAIKRILGP